METGKVYHTRMKQKIHPHQILKFRVHIFANQGQIRHTGVGHQYTLAYQISPGSVYSVVLIAAKSPNSRFLLQFQLSPPGGIETKLSTGAQLYEPFLSNTIIYEFTRLGGEHVFIIFYIGWLKARRTKIGGLKVVTE